MFECDKNDLLNERCIIVHLLKILYRNGMYHPKAHNQIPIMSQLTCNAPQSDEDEDDEIFSMSTRSSQPPPPPPTPSSGRRSTRRPVSNEVVYNTRMCDFMEKILKRTEPPTKNAFEKKVNDFCLVLENLMLKQPESIFDAFMIDVLRYAQDYNPTIVEVINQSNVKVLGAITSHAAFSGKQPTATFQNNNTLSFTGNIGNSRNPSPVGGLSANAPPGNQTTAEIHDNFDSHATQSQATKRSRYYGRSATN